MSLELLRELVWKSRIELGTCDYRTTRVQNEFIKNKYNENLYALARQDALILSVKLTKFSLEDTLRTPGLMPSIYSLVFSQGCPKNTSRSQIF